MPDDARQHDILRRNLRACLFLENPHKKRHSKFLGNTYVTMAKQVRAYSRYSRTHKAVTLEIAGVGGPGGGADWLMTVSTAARP